MASVAWHATQWDAVPKKKEKKKRNWDGAIREARIESSAKRRRKTTDNRYSIASSCVIVVVVVARSADPTTNKPNGIRCRPSIFFSHVEPKVTKKKKIIHDLPSRPVPLKLQPPIDSFDYRLLAGLENAAISMAFMDYSLDFIDGTPGATLISALISLLPPGVPGGHWNAAAAHVC